MTVVPRVTSSKNKLEGSIPLFSHILASRKAAEECNVWVLGQLPQLWQAKFGHVN
jgi:hypothetical protein